MPCNVHAEAAPDGAGTARKVSRCLRFSSRPADFKLRSLRSPVLCVCGTMAELTDCPFMTEEVEPEPTESAFENLIEENTNGVKT